MSLNTALALSLGVLGAIATWLFLGPLGGMLAIWAAFIAWGCYYHSGGKESALQSTIVCTAAGAIIAGITLKVAGMSIGLSGKSDENRVLDTFLETCSTDQLLRNSANPSACERLESM